MINLIKIPFNKILKMRFLHTVNLSPSRDGILTMFEIDILTKILDLEVTHIEDVFTVFDALYLADFLLLAKIEKIYENFQKKFIESLEAQNNKCFVLMLYNLYWLIQYRQALKNNPYRNKSYPGNFVKKCRYYNLNPRYVFGVLKQYKFIKNKYYLIEFLSKQLQYNVEENSVINLVFNKEEILLFETMYTEIITVSKKTSLYFRTKYN